MWQMIGVLAELERSLIVERTQAGMKEARRRGVALDTGIARGIRQGVVEDHVLPELLDGL